MTTAAPVHRRRRSAPDGGLFHASFSLGRVAGVPIGVNWSWLLVLVLVTWSLAAAVFPEQNPGLSDITYGVMAGLAAVLFFACLLLHELGHATIARREGMEIDGITLHTAYPVIDGDAVVGTVVFRAVAAVPGTEWAGRRVRDVMVPLSETLALSPDEPLFEAAVELMQTAAARGVVIDGGRLAGLLTLSDLSRVLELRRLTKRTDPGRPVPA